MASTAFYFHSSGTTGHPKLIPQTHNGAAGIQPRLQNRNITNDKTLRIATFTTTPLYSGGIADLFRCWSAASPLWIFPEEKAPIIGSTVSSCIRQIDALSQSEPSPKWRLGYMSCVPFVLENLVDTPELKNRLCNMDTVGVGGAAMPKSLGDQLVKEGLRLVSRFGSSECGFLLSSQRNYDKDPNWSVLRTTENSNGLEFAEMEDGDGKHELIVTNTWPLVSTAAHAQRPFNTHDVFVKSEEVEGGWVYVGRSDNQITLKTGKKFDPTPIEEALRQNDLIEDAVIVGSDRPFAAALIVPTRKLDYLNPADRLKAVWGVIENANRTSPLHARIRERCICILDEEQRSRIPRNNKGGVARTAVGTSFKDELAAIYGPSDEINPIDNHDSKISYIKSVDDIPTLVSHIVQSALGSSCQVNSNDSLFDAGVDSALSIQIRKRIASVLPENLRARVPLNVVYDCGTTAMLSQFVINLITHRENSMSKLDEAQSKHQEMLDMVGHYVSLQPDQLSRACEESGWQSNKADQHGHSIVLTGATGFLGVHILHSLLQEEHISTVFLCIRGSRSIPYEEQQQRVRARVQSALTSHQLEERISAAAYQKIEYVPFLLNEPCLGIPPKIYRHIAQNVTHVIHAAWEVKFNLPLKAFSAQIEGTINLFNLLALSSQGKPTYTPSLLFCSSIASIANMVQSPESGHSISKNPADAAPLGYAQSKWVAENVLHKLMQANRNVSVSIMRVGQLSGDTTTGIWNQREAWPLMIGASLEAIASRGAKTNSGTREFIFPDLASARLEPLDWLPVDCAAKHIKRQLGDHSVNPGLRIFDVCNRNMTLTWREVQPWMLRWAKLRGFQTATLMPSEWLGKLEESPVDHQSKALVALWRHNWVAEPLDVSTDNELGQNEGDSKGAVDGKEYVALCEYNALLETYPLDESYMFRILDRILERGSKP